MDAEGLELSPRAQIRSSVLPTELPHCPRRPHSLTQLCVTQNLLLSLSGQVLHLAGADITTPKNLLCGYFLTIRQRGYVWTHGYSLAKKKKDPTSLFLCSCA